MADIRSVACETNRIGQGWAIILQPRIFAVQFAPSDPSDHQTYIYLCVKALGVKWVGTDHERLDIDLTNNQKLYLGNDDEMRRRIWNQLIAHQSLPVNLWAIVFDMTDGGILAQFDKPYA